jgi:outer membrane receptor protein involved in Fe transport
MREGRISDACFIRLMVVVPIMLAPRCALAEAVPLPAKPTAALEQIVVTAQKRSERIDRVPISITAIGKKQLDKQGVRDIRDIARLVPGLHLQSSNELGSTNISIRGIVSDTGAQTTGVYIDETPVQARQEIVFSDPYPKVFDLDRVEVLRGPQGTLFGAGSEGGTIRFITPAPSLTTYSGYARSEVGFTDGGAPSGELGAAIGGPIVPDKLGMRISLWDRIDGGYIDRVNPVTGETDDRNANSQHSTVARAAFLLQATDALTIEPSVFYQRIRSEDRDFYWESVGPFKDLAEIPQPHADTYVLPSLSAGYDFGEFSARNVFSYFTRASDEIFDATSYELSGLLPGNAISVPGDPAYLSRGQYHQTQRNYTEEFRLSSTDVSDAVYSWVMGFYYQHNESGDENTFAEPFDQVANYLSQYYGYGPGNSLSYFGEAPVDGRYSYVQNILVTEIDKAVFGNFVYRITPTVHLAAGLRVSDSEFSYNDYQDGPYGPGAPTRYGGSKSETPVTPRFSISWQVTPDEMLYATVAKGYRIGGANESVLGIVSCKGDLAALGLKDVPATFQSDSVWSYEGGIKGSFLDQRLRLEASIFWIDWSAIQQQVELPDCGYYYTANLGNAASRGFDVQAQYSAGHGLVLSGNAGLTDARFVNNVIVGGNVLAKSGDSLATPEWTATSAVQQNFTLPRDATLYGRVDYQFAGPYYRTGSAGTFSYNPNTRDAPATNYVTLRSGLIRHGWDISAFINNALNSRTSLFRYQDTVHSPGLRDITYRPLTIGITAVKTF